MFKQTYTSFKRVHFTRNNLLQGNNGRRSSKNRVFRQVWCSCVATLTVNGDCEHSCACKNGPGPRADTTRWDCWKDVKQEAELALKLNSAAFYGDLYQLKSLIRAGADPNKTDYDGRSPLHLAASRGYEDITLYLIQESVDVNIKDKLGNTPLLEAIKNGNDRVATLLVKEGATLSIENAGTFLCTVVAKGDSDFLKRLLNNGIDPNSKDYDQRTPLHVASSEGLYLLARQLVEAGANVLKKDRWGNTPLDEALVCGNKMLIKLLEDAKTSQMSSFLNSSKEIKGSLY
ncbi:hypothetical protein F2Q70_00024098 [Brassica cretica]|uniref:PGG domain-containing protein n=1 Tax=Brassica cretica TaxID=69181 RepID=A0A8S9GNV0_BRACR|nr:hypothetical protein F2Q70_00024098 [Brassica cretica]